MSTLSSFIGSNVTIQTGYVSTSSLTSGTGEETKLLNVTITAVNDITKCMVFFVGGAASTSSGTVAITINNDNTTSSESNYWILPKLTSTTNLRLCSPQGGLYFHGRWYVVEYS